MEYTYHPGVQEHCKEIGARFRGNNGIHDIVVCGLGRCLSECERHSVVATDNDIITVQHIVAINIKLGLVGPVGKA